MGMNRLIMTIIALHNLISQSVTSDVDNQLMSANVDNGLLYGYQIGDITQGIGYGHYLHPFYYQGASQKYYKCAVEDEWKPLSGYRASVPSDDQHLRTPQKNISSAKKYQHLEEKLKKKVTHAKKDHVTPPRSPREKYDISAPRKHYIMQNRNDYVLLEEEQRLQQNHAKLVRDINDLSENQPFLKRLPEHDHILAFETDNDHETNIAKSPKKKYNIHQSSSYEVHENTMDVPPISPKAPPAHKFKPSQSKVPFQKYKKYRIIGVKPQSVIHLKYSASPNKNTHPKDEREAINNLIAQPQHTLKEPMLEGYHYPFVSSTKLNDVNSVHRYQHRPKHEITLKPMAFRQNHPPSAVTLHPRLTVLEQFLLIFPKFIR